MSLALLESLPKSRVKALLDHFSVVDDPRQRWKVMHPLPEILLLVVCGTICDCDNYAEIAAWGEAHLGVLRRYLPYDRKSIVKTFGMKRFLPHSAEPRADVLGVPA